MHARAIVIGSALAAGAFALDQPQSDTGARLAEQHKASYTDGGMERWQAHMAPGLAHQFLRERFAGSWKVTTTTTGDNMEGEHGPASEWNAVGRAILGGRYVEQRASGSMMGMPVESITVFGYDNGRRLFHATMFDTIGTGVKTLWGNLDQTGTVLTLVGGMDEPMSGEVGKSFMAVWTFHDDGTQSYVVKEILYGEAFAVIRAKAEPAG